MLIKLRQTPEQKVYVSSDFHLGHQREFVWQARGYENWDAHDKGVIDTINQTVRPDDILLFLGDFCLNTTLEKFNEYLSRINCKNLYCLWGNHNNPLERKVYFPSQPKFTARGIPIMTYPYEYRNMVFLPHYVEAILDGQYTILCHYPIYVWNEMSHGAWMLCGHSHYGCPLTKADSTQGKILDVGWDGHGKPWSLEEIAKVMDGKQIVGVDHHHPKMETPK